MRFGFEATPTQKSENTMGELSAFTVPETELNITFARSGGPGGQNVNKRSTKAVLKWNFGTSPMLDEEQKALVRTKLVNRINTEGEIFISYDQERQQGQNRSGAIRVLNELIAQAIQTDAERVATRPSRGAKERRMDEKTREGRKKEGRSATWNHD